MCSECTANVFQLVFLLSNSMLTPSGARMNAMRVWFEVGRSRLNETPLLRTRSKIRRSPLYSQTEVVDPNSRLSFSSACSQAFDRER